MLAGGESSAELVRDFAVICDTGACQIVDGTITGAQSSSIQGDRVTIRNRTATSNGAEGVQGYQKARAYDSTITNDGSDGIKGWTVQIERSTVSGNGEMGIGAGRYNGGTHTRGAKAKDSTVTGNGTNPACNTIDGPSCADVSSNASRRAIVLIGERLRSTSTCT